jgi:hypothetical protein
MWKNLFFIKLGGIPFNSSEKDLEKKAGILHLLKFDFKHSSESIKTSKQSFENTALLSTI